MFIPPDRVPEVSENSGCRQVNTEGVRKNAAQGFLPWDYVPSIYVLTLKEFALGFPAPFANTFGVIMSLAVEAQSRKPWAAIRERLRRNGIDSSHRYQRITAYRPPASIPQVCACVVPVSGLLRPVCLAK